MSATPPIRADGTPALLAAARDSRLVIFAGAGVSMAPPTNLPSWRAFNRSVVRALAAGAAPIVTAELADRAAALVLARHDQEKLPPEYQAQVLAEQLHDDYFTVLQHLDSDRPNATHLAIAWLARLGHVRAVITTNFDRTLEAAFAAVGAPLAVCSRHEHFAALANDLAAGDGADAPCRLLKLHGSVDDRETLIDTLAQRKRGLAAPLLDCVRVLLRSAHWLFLGYSGLDLEADRNYLLLRQEAENAVGFTWFVRKTQEPLDVVARLQQLYGARGGFVEGELPDWLVDFTASLSRESRDWIERRLAASGTPQPAATGALDRAALAWASRLSAPRCTLALTFVVLVSAEPQAAAGLAERLLASIDARPADTPGALLLKAVAADAYGLLIAGLGRHQEAVRWLEIAVDAATRAGDPDTADRCRGNLAYSLEALGRVAEARAAYDAALAGYRERGDAQVVALGLINLASHSIRQVRYGEARAFAEEAVRWATTAGDERARGTALFDLGKVARLEGDTERALTIFADVEALFTRLGDDHAVAAAVGDRAEALAELGRFDDAERLQLEVLRADERLDRLDNRAANLMGLGAIASRRGDFVAAGRRYAEARDAYRALADPVNEAFGALRMADAKLAAGAAEDAVALARDALPLAEGRNDAMTSDLWDMIGKASLARDDHARAEEAYRRVRELALASGRRSALAAATTNLGTIGLLAQRDADAASAFAEASAVWRELGHGDNAAYCELGEKAVRLDQRVAALSDAGHAARTRDDAHAAANEMLTLYPELVAMYEQLGARALAALFCESAGSTARFVGAVGAAGRWYGRAADLFLSIGRQDRERAALDRGETLLREWTNALIENGEFARALPEVLALAAVAERLGHAEMCASASLNAAIITVRTSQNLGRAKTLAERALALLPADSNDVATARAVIAHCT